MKKELYKEYFEGKNVTVMGLGLLGRGIGDTLFLSENVNSLIVTDKKNKEELSLSLNYLKDCHNINYVLGEHKLEDFCNRDFILKAAGVPLDSEYIKEAKRNNIPIFMSAALLSHILIKQMPTVKIIGVTGTRGKSTATNLIAHILKIANKKVHIGGNVRGVANLPLLKDIEDEDYLVLELDSWQLQGFGDLKISPHISVFTSFMDDHMNYYKGDKDAYFYDKANIYRHQKDGDILVTSSQAGNVINGYDKNINLIIPKDSNFEMKLIGDHNQTIANLCYEVARFIGVDDDVIFSAIKDFSPVSGRLEYMGVFSDKNIIVYNDNNATTEDATVMGIRAVINKYNKKPILIVGGADKGLPIGSLLKEIEENTKEVIYLKGTGTDRLNVKNKNIFDTLKECVDEAFSLCDEGDVILFSPSFASFSKEFNNEYERNDCFVKSVLDYKK